MRKLIFIIILCAFYTSASATTVLCRKSSGEVTAISLTNNSFSSANTTFWVVLTDPPLPNGTTVRDPNQELRVFGYAKINDNGTVRNATQNEINTFAAASTDDRNKREVQKALKYLQNHPYFRRIMIALADTLIEHEFNEYRTWFTNFQSEVAASTSLADFKTRMATLPAMPQRQLSQLRTQIENRISKDD